MKIIHVLVLALEASIVCLLSMASQVAGGTMYQPTPAVPEWPGLGWDHGQYIPNTEFQSGQWGPGSHYYSSEDASPSANPDLEPNPVLREYLRHLTPAELGEPSASPSAPASPSPSAAPAPLHLEDYPDSELAD